MMITPPRPVDITRFFPELADLERTTVRLHPRSAPDRARAESKLGGLLVWPADEPWPSCTFGQASDSSQRAYEVRFLDEEAQRRRMLQPTVRGIAGNNGSPAGEAHGPYVGVLQLRAADVPDLAFPAGADVFQLLWCPRDHPVQYCPDCRVYWRRAADVAAPLMTVPQPAISESFYLPRPCVLTPERVGEYPDIADLPTDLQERIWEWDDTAEAESYSYQYDLSVAPGTKVGGYVSWDQEPDVPLCPSCEAEMDYLLTIASGEGGEESWRPEGERDLPAEEQYRIRNATGLTFGRGGDFHLFICHQCPGWPIAWVQQG